MVFFFYIKSLKVKNSERVINHFDESANFIVNGKIKTSQLDVKKATKIEYSIPIFMYHFIRDDTGDYQYPENMVKPSSLKEQLKYLSENGYETIFVSILGIKILVEAKILVAGTSCKVWFSA